MGVREHRSPDAVPREVVENGQCPEHGARSIELFPVKHRAPHEAGGTQAATSRHLAHRDTVVAVVAGRPILRFTGNSRTMKTLLRAMSATRRHSGEQRFTGNAAAMRLPRGGGLP